MNQLTTIHLTNTAANVNPCTPQIHTEKSHEQSTSPTTLTGERKMVVTPQGLKEVMQKPNPKDLFPGGINFQRKEEIGHKKRAQVRGTRPIVFGLRMSLMGFIRLSTLIAGKLYIGAILKIQIIHPEVASL